MTIPEIMKTYEHIIEQLNWTANDLGYFRSKGILGGYSSKNKTLIDVSSFFSLIERVNAIVLSNVIKI